MILILWFTGILPLFAQDHQQTFDHRLWMTLDRLTGSDVSPVFTPEFILADVTLDPDYPRRFYNFSGDLSGRYIEVMSLFPEQAGNVNLDSLVQQLLRYQRPDGRFGDASLEFTAEQIGGEHMALLWGNGRLLVGLMQFYERSQDKQVLIAGRKLGDFFLQTYEACATPAVREKLKDFGAKGIICFTQYIEGLVMLSKHSGDPQYAEVAARAYPVLPDRGQQHTHGYLSTLRGVLDLYEYTQDAEHLRYVRQAYDNLVESDDYTAFGAVHEYFGGKGNRDEGCSTADFMRLSFHLYRLTGEPEYLERGEFALYNAFYFNQYFTGDFGSHFISEEGARPAALMASWWCCTMHGLRAMHDVKHNYLVTTTPAGKRVEMYLETTYQDDGLAFTIDQDGKSNDRYSYTLTIDKVNSSTQLALRRPAWATAMRVSQGDSSVAASSDDAYLTLAQPVESGDTIKIELSYRKIILTDQGQQVSPEELSKQPVSGVLQYGPYLMGADGYVDPTFLAEPSSNVVFAGSLEPVAADLESVVQSDVAITAQYQHGGYPSQLSTWLLPIAQQTFTRHGPLKMRMDFTTGVPRQNDQEMLNPWQPYK
ncbi:MAG: beta-L-arabinofuranosidase domain-containing protein [Tunicatimonas sp.]